MWGYFMNVYFKVVWEMYLLYLNKNWVYLYLIFDMYCNNRNINFYLK